MRVTRLQCKLRTLARLCTLKSIPMKFSRFLSAIVPLIAAGPLSVVAQSNVTLYGIVDAAAAIEKTGAPGSSRRLVLNSGNQSSSRLGFRGAEDLGDGFKAIFVLEAGIGLDTGSSDAAFFGRRAIVGLEGGLGTLTLGREYSPIAAVAGAADILGQGFFGTNLSAFATNRLTRRLSNSINYKTPSFGGVKASFAVSAAEQSAPGRVIGAALEYTAEPLYLGAGYHAVRRLGSADDKEYALGAGYNFGAFDVKANYLVADQAQPGNKFEQFNVGASVMVSTGRLYANVQQNKLQTGAKGMAYAVAYAYPLSKRTHLYATYAGLRNNASGVFGLSSASTSVAPPASAPGSDPSVLALGVRHSF